MRKQIKYEKIDETELKYGVEWVRGQTQVNGWVANLKTHIILDDNERESQVLLIFITTQDGQWLKCYYQYNPYFFLECEQDVLNETLVFLENKFEKNLNKIEIIKKLDLEQINHLSGQLKSYFKLSFKTVQDLISVRNQLKSRIEKNKLRQRDTFTKSDTDSMNNLLDIREYDVPYHCRVCIDSGLRCGQWYKFNLADRAVIDFHQDKTMIAPPILNYMSFDIETSKLPLKFPDAKIDQIMMISLQYETTAVLITNRQTVGSDVEGFAYAPKPEYAVDVIIYNEQNEQELLIRFFNIIKDYKPLIITSFNGDKFDWPFIEQRSLYLGLSLEEEIGLVKNEDMGEYYGRYLCHMDCFPWVERDAFLPQGSHGLKAVTRSKLGYEPVEVDPEEMVIMAQRNSQKLAEYSISDAVATYFLYKKHIHDFIFALCTIIPLSPDEVLRKGSGTLCECLLMGKAYDQNIIFPNKKKENFEKFYQGHLLDSETYIGGKVECLRSGVYRQEFPQSFRMDLKSLQEQIDSVPNLLEFMSVTEGKKFGTAEVEKCTREIQLKLQALLDRGEFIQEKPLIYHLDVGAMYPNIILTNRLQPVAIVDNKICSGCVFNTLENNCKRPLEWQWKGEYFPITRNEFESIKLNLEYEYLNKPQQIGPAQQLQVKSFYDLPVDEQQKLIKQRVKLASQKTYRTIHHNTVQLRKDTVCMRENDFYVSTVRDFRDRRYEFKESVKVWKTRLDEGYRINSIALIKESKDKIAFYDSQQLAHKIILNSFYGYVMRRGARWYSMEMAAMVTHIGSAIISTARQWVERVGLPLELDTDGIWCMFPHGFPEDFVMLDTDGKRVKFNYPCFVLNQLVYGQYKNDQYQWLRDGQNLDYGTRTEMSIFFEVDGPYKCMMIPAAREEGKQLKKRYVVYHKNGSIAELKGFEIKRRGELRIIKIFQEEIFRTFCSGETLSECFEECGRVSKKWLQLLQQQGQGLDDKELIYYIGESRMLSKDLKEYDVGRKGVAITAGKRMAEFLGADTVKGPGLNCTFVISKKPISEPIAQRAIPISIFETDSEVRSRFLRKWLKDPGLQDYDLEMRNLLDWDYYMERLGNSILKILVIPAVLQGSPNPVPELQPPEWLRKRLREQNSGFLQKKLGDYFSKHSSASQAFAQIRHKVNEGTNNNRPLMEIEDLSGTKGKKKPMVKQLTPMKINDHIINDLNMDTQFTSWIEQQKKVWHNLNAKRKAQGSQYKQVIKATNLLEHFNQQILSMEQSIWQILQIYQVEPGKFIVWAILESGVPNKSGQLINVSMMVERRLYVHSHKKQENRTLVKRILPREKQLEFLYEVTLSESEFNNHGNFVNFLANPNIEGLYEQNEPLQFQLLTELGSMWKLNKKVNEGKKDILHNLESQDFRAIYELANHGKYLEPEEQDIITNHLFIENIIFDQNRAIWALFCPSSCEYTILVASQVQTKQDYRGVARLALKKLGLDANLKIRVQIVENHQQACLYVESYFYQLKQSNVRVFGGLKMCILRSHLSLVQLQSYGLKFPCLEFPCLFLNQEEQEASNPAGWIERAIRMCIEKYGDIDQTIQTLLSLGRYASIPLCNVCDVRRNKQNSQGNQQIQSGDYLNNVTDVLYSRVLKQIYHGISWYGMKMKDLRDLIPSEFEPTEYIYPGIYMSYCVQIDILQLVLNTIALSDELKNIDREVSALLANDIVDELSCAKTAFRVLKTLVIGWLEDVMERQDRVSDELLQNICRWIYGADISPLYDEYLGKILTRLNKKSFQQFMLKLKQLGAKIIYASQYKIIISTGKQTLKSAQQYTNYILEDLIQQPLFKYLSLNPTRYYSALIYKDQYNYLGYQVKAEEQSDNDDYELDYKLNLNLFLPHRLQIIFEGILIQFLDSSKQYRQKCVENAKNEKTAQAVFQLQQLEIHTLQFLTEYIRDQLSVKLYNVIPVLIEAYQSDKRKQLFMAQKQQYELQNYDIIKNRISNNENENDDDLSIEQEDQQYEEDSFIVNDNQIDYDENINILPDANDHDPLQDMDVNDNNNISNNNNGNNLNDLTFDQNWEMPNRIGLKLDYKLSSIANMLIYLFHMLSLDESTEQEVRRIKANCCTLLQISVSSIETQFKDPCLTLLLSNIICKNCYDVCENIDLFRQQDELICQNCNCLYDSNYLEDQICDFFEKYLGLYQIQDLYCIKCKQVQEDPVSKRCQCSGQYRLQQNQFPNDLIQNFKNFQQNLLRFSVEKNMPYLKELLSQIK